jgi:hypothetical protein
MLQRQRIYKLVLGDSKDAVIITDLQISFDVNKNSDNKKTSNGATVEIYNLSDATLKRLEKEYLEASLSVGHEDTGLVLLLKGQVTQVSTKRNGTDKVTQLQLGEGYVELNQQFLKGVTPAGSTVADTIEEIRKQMPGVAKGAFTGLNINSQVLFGYPLTGTPRQMLSEISEAYRVEFSIDRGALSVRDETGISEKNLTTAFVLNESSGLVDIPYHTTAKGAKLKGDKTKRKGVQVKALLNARIIPGSAIKIESKLINGWFKVSSARYFGSYNDNDWYVECFCREILSGDIPA